MEPCHTMDRHAKVLVGDFIAMSLQPSTYSTYMSSASHPLLNLNSMACTDILISQLLLEHGISCLY